METQVLTDDQKKEIIAQCLSTEQGLRAICDSFGNFLDAVRRHNVRVAGKEWWNSTSSKIIPKTYVFRLWLEGVKEEYW